MYIPICLCRIYFFQAEDGIRDYKVTGVQTCALPIYLIPLPNLPGVSSNFLASGSQRLTRDNFDTKINWNRTASHTMWGKYSIMNAEVGCDPAFGAGGGAALCPSGSNIGAGTLRTQVATIGSTYIFSPSFLWDGLFGWTRQGQSITGFDYGKFDGRTFGIPGVNGNSQN